MTNDKWKIEDKNKESVPLVFARLFDDAPLHLVEP
jgi:hypothetical protein